MKTMERIFNRFKEPSSWAGLSSASVLFGVGTDQMNMWVGGFAGICAFLSVVMAEMGSGD